MKPDLIVKAEEIIGKSDAGYFTVIQPDGFPETAARSNIRPDGIRGCFFATGTSGAMAAALRENGKASVCFRNDGDNVTLTGHARIISEKKIKEDLWQDWFINHFPGGLEDQEYTVVRFDTFRVSLWVDRKQEHFTLDQILKPQSRCGLFCDFCSFAETHNCGGCIKTEGNPFYGSCPIARCCQDRGYEHCGMCPEMPCSLLKEYSCGEGEHCDNPKGARLEILRKWTQ